MEATEITVGKKWIYNTLTAIPAVTSLLTQAGEICIYPDYARKIPAIVYATYSLKDDSLAIGGNRIKANIEFTIKAITKAENVETASELASLIDRAFKKASGSVPEGIVISCLRRIPLDFIEKNPEVTYQHMGGVYRMEIQLTI
jgi:hypothetical protein